MDVLKSVIVDHLIETGHQSRYNNAFARRFRSYHSGMLWGLSALGIVEIVLVVIEVPAVTLTIVPAVMAAMAGWLERADLQAKAVTLSNLAGDYQIIETDLWRLWHGTDDDNAGHTLATVETQFKILNAKASSNRISVQSTISKRSLENTLKVLEDRGISVS